MRRALAVMSVIALVGCTSPTGAALTPPATIRATPTPTPAPTPRATVRPTPRPTPAPTRRQMALRVVGRPSMTSRVSLVGTIKVRFRVRNTGTGGGQFSVSVGGLSGFAALEGCIPRCADAGEVLGIRVVYFTAPAPGESRVYMIGYMPISVGQADWSITLDIDGDDLGDETWGGSTLVSYR